MSLVAEQLRTARETRHLTISQVAEATKIRTDHIRAMEEGNFSAFSAPVYIRGSVRNYATMLKLDVAQIMAELNAELGQTKKLHEPPPLTKEPHGVMDFITLQLSRFNWQKVLIFLGGTAVVIFLTGMIVMWVRHKNSDPLADLKPGVYQGSSSGDTLPVPPPRAPR